MNDQAAAIDRRCYFCTAERMDGHLTCGQASCSESQARELRDEVFRAGAEAERVWCEEGRKAYERWTGRAAGWTATCPTCAWEFQALAEGSPDRNPYPDGILCPQCQKSFMFLARAERSDA